MSERADLPDVPEAAVEAGADQLATKSRTKRIGKGYPWQQRFIMLGDRESLARSVLTAALPVLTEQGWKPPEARG